MKKSANKRMLGLLAILMSAGVVHAENGVLRLYNVTPAQVAIINELVQQGYIVPLPEANWYQINKQRLMEAYARRDAGDVAANDVIEKLRTMFGKEVDIRRVEIFGANVGGQDF